LSISIRHVIVKYHKTQEDYISSNISWIDAHQVWPLYVVIESNII